MNRWLSSGKRCLALAVGLVALALGSQPVTIAFGASITVTSPGDSIADDGVCTLREAIIAANTNLASGGIPGECGAGGSGTDRISFNFAGSGVRLISVSSQLPSITSPVVI